jgi:protein SCO1
MKYFLLPVSLIILLAFVAFSINLIPGSGIIEKNKKIYSSVFNPYKNKVLLVFFGYIGCSDVCTPRLTELAKIYQQLSKTNKNDVAVVFVNLTQLSNSTLADLYAKTYHPDFNGMYVDTSELNDLKAEFNVYNSPSLISENTYNHTALLFLLKKATDGYYLKRIYVTTPFDQSLILKDIKKNFL